MYKELWLYEPSDDLKSFHSCMFHLLFDLYMKISNDCSADHRTIKELFFVSFEPYWLDKNPPSSIERTITKLVSLIRLNPVIDNHKNPRYDLDIPGEPAWVPKDAT